MNSCRLGSSSYALGVHSFFLSLYCCSNFRKNELECNGRQEGYSRRAIVCSVHGLIVTDRTRRSGDCWERTSCWLRRGQLSCTGGWGNQTKPLRGTPTAKPMLEVTCHHHCPVLLNASLCAAKRGCVWANATDVLPASCAIDALQGFTGHAWIGTLCAYQPLQAHAPAQVRIRRR